MDTQAGRDGFITRERTIEKTRIMTALWGKIFNILTTWLLFFNQKFSFHDKDVQLNLIFVTVNIRSPAKYSNEKYIYNGKLYSNIGTSCTGCQLLTWIIVFLRVYYLCLTFRCQDIDKVESSISLCFFLPLETIEISMGSSRGTDFIVPTRINRYSSRSGQKKNARSNGAFPITLLRDKDKQREQRGIGACKLDYFLGNVFIECL